jgi:hypothetical protein
MGFDTYQAPASHHGRGPMFAAAFSRNGEFLLFSMPGSMLSDDCATTNTLAFDTAFFALLHTGPSACRRHFAEAALAPTSTSPHYLRPFLDNIFQANFDYLYTYYTPQLLLVSTAILALKFA